jgi:hypothetical protein
MSRAILRQVAAFAESTASGCPCGEEMTALPFVMTASQSYSSAPVTERRTRVTRLVVSKASGS